MDGDVRRLVLSPASREVHIEPAVLQRYRRVFMAERVYPVIAPSPATSVAGILSGDLSDEDAARLAAFESDEYDEVALDVIADNGESISARVFVAGQRAVQSAKAWDLAEWQRQHKRMFLRRTQRRI